MKKLLLFALPLAIAVSCGSSQKKMDDSIRTADSMAAVEADMAQDHAAEEQAKAAEEKANMDSIRQDSIAKANDDAFYNSLPDPQKIVWEPKAGDYLKKLGFQGSTKKGNDESEAEGSYTLKQGDKVCNVHFITEYNVGDTEITINGDEEALNKYYKRAQKMRATYEEGGTTVEKKGNTVFISSFGA